MFARSLYKFVPINFNSYKKITSKIDLKFKTLLNKSFLKKKADLIVNDLNSIVLPALINRRVMVYNGVSFSGFLIRRSMVGLPFYKLIRTKKLGQSIHIDKKSKKKKK